MRLGPPIKIDRGLSENLQISTYKRVEKNNYCGHWATALPTKSRKRPNQSPSPSLGSLDLDRPKTQRRRKTRTLTTRTVYGSTVTPIPGEIGMSLHSPACELSPSTNETPSQNTKILQKGISKNPKSKNLPLSSRQVRKKLSPASAAIGRRDGWEYYNLCEACQRNLNAGASFTGPCTAKPLFGNKSWTISPWKRNVAKK